ncbi:hypothetical protein C8Q78DRAFT_981849 [Trametes maxima]|nr:hypothetical protein C8Q78DRAFT_981849 [Trametes maxima]
MPIPLYVRERGGAPMLQLGDHRNLSVAYYDLIVQPNTPIQTGMRVSVHPLVAVPASNGEIQWRLVSRVEEVEGEIIGLRAMEKHLTEFVVKNERGGSTIEYAYVAVPHHEGVTVQTGWIESLFRWIIAPFLLETRTILIMDRTQIDDEPMHSPTIIPGAGDWPPLQWRRELQEYDEDE